ncbi:hypothetical protein F5Y14DRAFT_443098 [Nemania sp. NC0429]|nr:hypothetical protein F5Y14DRAFT_443098 [Nemania sp. NC0429]
MVRRAGLTIVTDASETASFTLANGKMIQAIGQVVVRFSFAKTPPSTTSTMTYMFYVFSRLAVPLIIGMAVLEQTETFSKHRDRLVEEIVPSIQALRVGSIGKPKRQLACQVNHHIGYATADTGSDLDLISLEFAISKDFEIMPAFEQVEFADGSYGITCGVIEAKFTTGTPDPITGLLQPLNSVTIERDFYILDNLTSAIVVGIDTLEELDIFSHHSGSLLSTTSRTGFSDVNVIRHVGKAERGCKKIWKSFKDQFGKPIQNNKDIEDLRQLQEDILLADQRENARREQRRGYISGLVGIAQDSAQAEEEQKIKQYETARERQLSDHSKTTNELATPVVSPLSPPIPGSSPHYYPARGYPRSKEGEGFERKSEVIRHVQIHKPLEYVCPFCTDRELKYSWQHDLKLHVRVYHADKVLSQLPEGPTRGRRWRGLAS